MLLTDPPVWWTDGQTELPWHIRATTYMLSRVKILRIESCYGNGSDSLPCCHFWSFNHIRQVAPAYTPIYYMAPWAHMSLSPNGISVSQCSCFCRAHSCAQYTHRHTAHATCDIFSNSCNYASSACNADSKKTELATHYEDILLVTQPSVSKHW